MASSQDTSDDFFNSFNDSKAPKAVAPRQLKTSSTGGRSRTTVPRASGGKAPPPPPPPRQRPAATNTSAAASNAPAAASYYGSQPAKPSSSMSVGGFQQPPAAETPATSTGSAPAPPYHQNPSTHLQTAGTGTAPGASYYGGGGTSQPTSSDWYSQPQQTQQEQQPLMQTQQAGFQQPNMMTNPFGVPTSSNPVSAPGFEGSMDTNASKQKQQPSLFVPTVTSTSSAGGSKGSSYDPDEFENEPPLLEELGINLEHILFKTKAVVIPFKRLQIKAITKSESTDGGKDAGLLEDPKVIVEDADMAGPLAFALLLGGEMLLSGKIQFGYIYGFGVFGCVAMTFILNLMNPTQPVSFWTVTSILGYALLPVNLLAATKLFLLNLANLTTLTRCLAILTVVWSTTASTRLLEVGCGMRSQRYLVAYPIALLYSAFVLITIF